MQTQHHEEIASTCNPYRFINGSFNTPDPFAVALLDQLLLLTICVLQFTCIAHCAVNISVMSKSVKKCVLQNAMCYAVQKHHAVAVAIAEYYVLQCCAQIAICDDVCSMQYGLCSIAYAVSTIVAQTNAIL
jgi:hypothetical protein